MFRPSNLSRAHGGSARLWRAAWACALALGVCAPNPAQAQARALDAAAPAPAVITALRITTDVHALQVRRGDFAVATRRAFVQQFTLDASDVSRVVALHVRASTSFDQALASRPRLAVLRERQLDAALEAAELRWRPVAPLTLRGGRITRVTDLGWQRVDGAALRLDLPAGTWVDLSAGARPGEGFARLTGSVWDADVPQGRQQPSGVSWEASTGVDWGRDGAAGFGYRADLRDGRRLAELAALWVRAGEPGRRQLRMRAQLDVLGVRLSEAELHAEQRLGERAHLYVGGRFRRPTFALDSIFSVFPAASQTALWLGARGRSVGIDFEGRVGARLQGNDDSVATAAASVAHRWLRVGADGAVGSTRWHTALNLAATWSVARSATIGLQSAASWTRNPDGVLRRTARTAALGARTSLEAGDWGSVGLRVDGVLSDASGASAEAWATLRVALPAWSSRRRGRT